MGAFKKNKGVFGVLGVVVFTCTGVYALAQTAPSTPVNATLESSLTGRTRQLSQSRGKIIVAFYEDKEHTSTNEDVKGLLVRLIADNHLETKMELMAIANPEGFTADAVRPLVRAGLKEASKRIGMDILVDWQQQLLKEPFRLSNGASNVFMMDQNGAIVFKQIGRLEGHRRSEMFRKIRQMLRPQVASH